MTDMPKFDFKAWREALGWSQAEAALELGYTRPHYSDLERGRLPHTKIMVLACQFLILHHNRKEP